MFKTLHLVWFMGNKHYITIMWVKQCHKPAMTGNGLYHLFMVIWGIRFLIFGFLAVGTSCRLYFLSLYTGWSRNVKNGFPSSWIRIIPNMLGTPYNQPTGFWTLLKWLCLFCLKMLWKKGKTGGNPKSTGETHPFFLFFRLPFRRYTQWMTGGLVLWGPVPSTQTINQPLVKSGVRF